jgi:hypothetical protein
MLGKTFSIAALIMACAGFFAGSDGIAGEKWQDNMGITVAANNYNADLIRRSRNRRRRDLGEVNSIPRHLYDATRRRSGGQLSCWVCE